VAKLSPRTVKKIRSYLEKRSDEPEARTLLGLIPRATRKIAERKEQAFAAIKPGFSRRELRQTKVKERGSLRSRLRAFGMERCGGNCEVCGRYFGEALHMDHYFGGSNKSRMEKRFGLDCIWMICPTDHYAKTKNHPNRERWDCLFRDHCLRHGYDTAKMFKEAQR